MRIIEQRDELRQSCPNCQSVLGIEPKDLREAQCGYSYRCPTCGRINHIGHDEIPDRWWKILDPTGA